MLLHFINHDVFTEAVLCCYHDMEENLFMENESDHVSQGNVPV